MNSTPPSSKDWHILSVDVEDYFQVEAFAKYVSPTSWEQWPSRVVANTRRILSLFDRYDAKATFFFVGWVADRFPALVREVLDHGHEIACHSYWHQCIYKLTPEQFKQDTERALRVIEQAAHVQVRGYRAPSWSITAQCQWAIPILQECGFSYDSSVFPIHHDIYGLPGAQRFPYEHVLANHARLPEFPPTTVKVGKMILPAAGGGYLRLMPTSYTDMAFRTTEAQGQKVLVYLHPWELDPEQPRIHASLRSRFRHYTNLSRMESRLLHLLRTYRFRPLQEFALQLRPPRSVARAA